VTGLENQGNKREKALQKKMNWGGKGRESKKCTQADTQQKGTK
jgi:hypothetical protein